MLFYWYKLIAPFIPSTVFPFLLFLFVGWYCGAGVFGLIGRQSLSPGLTMPTFFNNNNNNNNNINNNKLYVLRPSLHVF